nr:hypothetical protein [Tanacetum cinerariifolium]
MGSECTTVCGTGAEFAYASAEIADYGSKIKAIGNSSNVNGENVDDNTRIYVEEALAEIRRSMDEMLNQIHEISLQNLTGAANRGLIFRCVQLFLIDTIPEDQKIRLLSVHLFDKALMWHRRSMDEMLNQIHEISLQNLTGAANRGLIFRCVQLFLINTIPEDQKIRLLSVHLFDKALIWHRQFLKVHELKNVKYDSNAKEYQDKFDDLLSRVEISVEHSVSLYLAGLPSELEMGVRMFKLQNLADAYCLTNLQEAILNAVKKKNKMQFGASSSKFGNNEGNTGVSTKPLLALPNATINWSSRHNTNPPRKQLSQNEYKKKRVVYEWSGIHLLIDSAFTHNFLDTKMAKRLGCAIRPTCPLTVNVAEEMQLLTVSECKGFTWKLKGETFVTDVMLLLLEGCDMVLGIHWLSTLGDIKSNFKDLRMDFVYNNKKMVLKGTHETKVEWAEALREQRNDKVLKPELTQIVENFSDVFEVPHELPPKRNHDHRIPLIHGTPPINIRPYRHPPIQKDAIK